MATFPVYSSILSPAYVAVFIKDTYNFGTGITAGIIKTGISHTYLITASNSKYVFRVYSLNWRSEKEIAEEIYLLRLLHDNNVPVSYAIADAAGTFIQQLHAPEGVRFGVMFSFAAGEKMLNLTDDLHYRAGKIMAGMHKVTHQLQLDRITYTPDVLLIDSLNKIKKFLPEGSGEMTFLQKAQTSLLDMYSKMDIHSVRKGVVHLDIWFDNMTINNNTDITLFDFDFCGNGWLFLDIGYYLLQVYSTEKDASIFAARRDAFLEGYESVTALTTEEKRLLPSAGISLYFFYLGVQCSRFNDWSNVFLNEIYLKRFINLLVKKWAGFNGLQFS